MEEIRVGRKKVETDGAKQSGIGIDECDVGRREVVWVDEGEWDGEKLSGKDECRAVYRTLDNIYRVVKIKSWREECRSGERAA
jgi:hypothetical protein